MNSNDLSGINIRNPFTNITDLDLQFPPSYDNDKKDRDDVLMFLYARLYKYRTVFIKQH